MSDKGKVGIVTLVGNFNYGNKLQLYASTNIYRSLGFSPIYLVYNRHENAFAHPKVALMNMLKIRDSKATSPEMLQSAARSQAFGRFNKLIPQKDYSDISEIDPEEYEYFSVGSDQVWNPGNGRISSSESFIKRSYHSLIDPKAKSDYFNWWFLKFARPDQRIALAPSIGLDSITPEQGKWIANGIEGIEHLSIREKRGAELIYQYTDRKARIICDPTLAISRSEWEKVSDARLDPEGDYIFQYLLGGETAESKDALRLIFENSSMPVVKLSERSRDGEVDAGPAEFLSLIKNAKHVIIDSFHASVFSAIFETPLTVVHRSGSAQQSMFARIESLAETLNIQNKVYSRDKWDQDEHADFENVAESIHTQRDKFMEFLLDCLK